MRTAGTRAARLFVAAVVLMGSWSVVSLEAEASAAGANSPELVPFTGTRTITATWGAPSGGYHATPAIDVAMPVGTPIYAAGAGEIIEARVDNRHCDPSRYANFVQGCINAGFGGSGTRIRIRHPDGRISFYHHLSAIRSGIAVGVTVFAGERIGSSGNTGISTGPHLHYAEYVSGVEVDPGVWVACHGSTRVNYGNLQHRRGQSIRNDGYGCSTTPPSSPVTEGSFVSVGGHVYRVVGGAPVYVSSWSAVGGQRPVTTISSLSQLRKFPADGTLVNADGHVYRYAGAAAIYVSSWASIGGERPSIRIDPQAISRAGTGRWADLRVRPADGTFVNADGHVFRYAGGAAIYVSSWNSVGGSKPSVRIDPRAISRAGTSRWADLRVRPANGTFVNADGHVFRFAGGAPLYVSNWNSVGGSKPSVRIDPRALSDAGKGRWANIRVHPANGTFVRNSNGTVFRFAGGAPLRVHAWSHVGGSQSTTLVDQYTLDRRNALARRHVRQFPANGTVLQGGPSGRYWRVADNQRSEISATSGAVRVSDAGMEYIPVVK